jgi:hypothetical protein
MGSPKAITPCDPAQGQFVRLRARIKTMMRIAAVVVAAAVTIVRGLSQPLPLSEYSDEGTFFLYLNEECVASLGFRWTPDGTFESRIVVSIGGQSAGGSTELVPDGVGRWVRAVLESATGKWMYERVGTSFKATLPGGSGNGTIPENAIVFEDWIRSRERLDNNI